MILHWLMNNNTCALTIFEKFLRKKLNNDYDENNCFTCKLIEPVYDFKNNYETFSKIIYLGTIILWLIALGKLYYKWRTGLIKSWSDLVKL